MIDAVKFLRMLNFWIWAYIVTLVVLVITVIVLAKTLYDLGNRPLTDKQKRWLARQNDGNKTNNT